MTVVLAILLTGLGTYACRALFIVAVAQRRFPPLMLRALEYVAPAVMAALVVSMLTGEGSRGSIGIPEVAALACAVATAWRTRNHIATLAVGMTTFWLLAAVFSGHPP